MTKNPLHGAVRQGEHVEFIKALVSAWNCCGTCAGGVLGRHDERVRAKALTDAADAVDEARMTHVDGLDVSTFLRTRAEGDQ